MDSQTLDLMYQSEMDNQYKAERKSKNEWKRKLKGLINISGLFKFLDDHDYWSPDGFVNIVLTDYKKPGYANSQCAQIDGKGEIYLYCKFGDVRSVDHYYVCQYTTYEDSYHGTIIFPLTDGRYFKASYAC